MNRNIWRGRKPSDGHWVYGDLCSRNMDGRVYIRVLDKRENGGRTIRLCAVETDTVGECTGATDCNGTPIFEGDVLESWFEDCEPEDVSHVVVKWAECGFFLGSDGETDQLLELCMSQYLRVIGNVHDDPDCAAWHGCSTCVYSDTWMEDYDGVFRCDYCDTITGRRGNCPYWSDGSADEEYDEYDDEYDDFDEPRRPGKLAGIIAGAAIRITERRRRKNGRSDISQNADTYQMD